MIIRFLLTSFIISTDGKMNDYIFANLNMTLPTFVRFSAIQKIPFIIGRCEEVVCQLSSEDSREELEFYGYSIDLLYEIAKELRFKWTLDVYDQNHLNGNQSIYHENLWNNDAIEYLINLLKNNETDVLFTPITATWTTANQIDLTLPFYGFSGLSILMQRHEDNQSIWSFISEVFDWRVWLAIGGTIILTGLTIAFIERVSPYSVTNSTNEDRLLNGHLKYSLKESLWFAFGSFLLSSGERPPNPISARALLTAFWFFSTVCISTYQANLAAFLTSSRLTTAITSVQDLAAQSDIKYSVVNGSEAHRYFRQMRDIEEEFFNFWKKISLSDHVIQQTNYDFNLSKLYNDSRLLNQMSTHTVMNLNSDEFSSPARSGRLAIWDYPLDDTFTQLWNSMSDVGLLNGPIDGLKLALRDSSFAFIYEETAAKFEEQHNPHMITVGSSFSMRPVVFGVQKESQLTKLLDRCLVFLKQNGVVQRLKTKWWESSDVVYKEISKNFKLKNFDQSFEIMKEIHSKDLDHTLKSSGRSQEPNNIISLNTLGGAFIILSISLCIALLSLIVMHIQYIIGCNRCRSINNNSTENDNNNISRNGNTRLNSNVLIIN
ncbi:hypothetical protein SNEBB_010452 [Seison nebaliae]|nr:hypothetical protein SNEBB_010452 [Seison nebaliae]